MSYGESTYGTVAYGELSGPGVVILTAPVALDTRPHVTLAAPVALDTRERAKLFAPVWLTTGYAVTLSAPVDINTRLVTLSAPVAINTGPQRVLAAPVAIDTATDYSVAERASVLWGLGVTIDGVDYSYYLTGRSSVEREGNASIVAEFLLMPPPGVIDMQAIDAKPVVFDFIDYQADGQENYRLTVFRGKVSEPTFFPTTGILRVRATTDQQGWFNGMSTEQIERVVPGEWSQHVFLVERLGWERAQDILSTLEATMWHKPDGGVHFVPWEPGAVDREYGDNDVLADSISVRHGRRRELLNRLQLNFDFRFQRLRQRTISCRWVQAVPFCEFLKHSFLLCQRSQVEAAAHSDGDWVLLKPIEFRDLPPPGRYYCPFPIVWGQSLFGGAIVVEDPDNELLCQGASWLASRRWAQTVTEKYAIDVRAPVSMEGNGERAELEEYGIKVDQDVSDWVAQRAYEEAGEGFTVVGGSVDGGDGIVLGDQVKEANEDVATGRIAFEQAQRTALAAAAAELRGSHRGTRVSWSTLFDPTISPDMTPRLNTKLKATGRLDYLRHRFDLDAGSAITDGRIAISRAGGVGLVTPTPLAPVEPPPVEEPAAEIPKKLSLGTHVGGLTTSAPFNEAWTGYITNYEYDPTDTDPFAADPDDPEAKYYPNRFVVDYPEIDGAHLNAVEAKAARTIEVDIRNDELILEQ